MTTRSTTIRLLVMALLLMVIGTAAVHGAGTRGLNWAVGCEGFTNVGGGIILDRDNTGTGDEAFSISATDGLGNQIFGPLRDASEVGTEIYLSEGVFFRYGALPVANPITVTLTSLAGNGLAAEVIYTATGNCDEIGSAATTEDIDMENLQDVGLTSPSVPLNGTAPRPANEEVFFGSDDNYLIVDTVTANLRSGDGPQYTIVGQVDGGTNLIVLGRNPARSWFYVRADDIRGWINASLVIIRGDLTELPVVPSRGEIYPPRLYVYSTNPIRLSPSSTSLVLCSVGGDLEYPIIGQNANGSWFRIRTECNGRPVNGWIRSATGALRNSGDLTIPVID